jgi:hypothetical protein
MQKSTKMGQVGPYTFYSVYPLYRKTGLMPVLRLLVPWLVIRLSTPVGCVFPG